MLFLNLTELHTVEQLTEKLKTKQVLWEEVHEMAFGGGSPSELNVRVRTSLPSSASYENRIIQALLIEDEIKKIRSQIYWASVSIREAAFYLSREDAELIVLRYVELLRVPEIAKRLGCSRRTVERRLRSAAARYYNLSQDKTSGVQIKGLNIDYPQDPDGEGGDKK